MDGGLIQDSSPATRLSAAGKGEVGFILVFNCIISVWTNAKINHHSLFNLEEDLGRTARLKPNLSGFESLQSQFHLILLVAKKKASLPKRLFECEEIELGRAHSLKQA